MSKDEQIARLRNENSFLKLSEHLAQVERQKDNEIRRLKEENERIRCRLELG